MVTDGTIQLKSKLKLNNLAINAKECSWNFWDGSPDTVSDAAEHIYNVPGTYQIVLTAKSDLGCSVHRVNQSMFLMVLSHI